jgi:hypothetical protein
MTEELTPDSPVLFRGRFTVVDMECDCLIDGIH